MGKQNIFLIIAVLLLILTACQGDTAENETAEEPSTPTAVSTTEGDSDEREIVSEIVVDEAPTAPQPTQTPTAVPTTIPLPTREPITVTYSDGTTEEVPALQPIDLIDYVEEGVSLNLWDETEGLLTVFGYLMGQTGETAVPRIEEVREKSLSTTLRLLETKAVEGTLSADQQARFDLYQQILLPSPESLDLFSEPETGTESGSNGHNAPGVAALASQSDCTALAGKGFPTADYAGRSCFKFTEFTNAGFTHRIYYPIGSAAEQAQIAIYKSAMEEALQKSVAAYTPFGTMRNVHILLRPTLYRGTTQSSTDAHQINMDASSEVCNLVFFKGSFGSSGSADLEVFKQTVAHELFHCFQDWNFNTSAYHEWWGEGSAEYFSNLAYPKVDHEHRYFSDFDAKSTTQPVTAMSYDNAVFFQYLANKLGSQGVIDLLKTFTGGPGQHIQAMRQINNMDGLFNEFVVRIMSSGVADTAGAPFVLAKPQMTNVKLVKEAMVFDYSPAPFVAARYGLVYEEERKFDQEFTETNIKHSAVEKDMRSVFTNWSEMPSEIRSKCDDRIVYLLAATAVDAGATYKLNVTDVEEASCDPCLLGTWDVNPVLYGEWIEALAAREGGADMAGMSLDVTVTGHSYVQFMDDGRFLTSREAFGLQFSVAGMGSINNVTNASGGGSYTADGETLTALTLSQTISDVSGDVNAAGGQSSFLIEDGSSSFFGGGVSITVNEDGGLNDAVEKPDPVAYVCTDDTVTFTHPELGDMEYVRVDEILPTPVPTAVAP